MKVVKKAFELLALLKHFDSLPLKSVAASLGTSPASAWNLLDFLRREGYVEKRGCGRYALGPAFDALFSSPGPERLQGPLGKALTKLSSAIRESSVAVRLAKGSLQVLCAANCERELMVGDAIYKESGALYRWASGRVLLAFQREGVLDAVLACRGLPSKAQWAGVQSRAALEAELARLREASFAERYAEDSGVLSLAVPLARKGRAPLALGVACPAFRATPLHKEAILGNLRLAAEALAGEL